MFSVCCEKDYILIDSFEGLKWNKIHVCVMLMWYVMKWVTCVKECIGEWLCVVKSIWWSLAMYYNCIKRFPALALTLIFFHLNPQGQFGPITTIYPHKTPALILLSCTTTFSNSLSRYSPPPHRSSSQILLSLESPTCVASPVAIPFYVTPWAWGKIRGFSTIFWNPRNLEWTTVQTLFLVNGSCSLIFLNVFWTIWSLIIEGINRKTLV